MDDFPIDRDIPLLRAGTPFGFLRAQGEAVIIKVHPPGRAFQKRRKLTSGLVFQGFLDGRPVIFEVNRQGEGKRFAQGKNAIARTGFAQGTEAERLPLPMKQNGGAG
jgi:hypothetical protein